MKLLTSSLKNVAVLMSFFIFVSLIYSCSNQGSQNDQSSSPDTSKDQVNKNESQGIDNQSESTDTVQLIENKSAAFQKMIKIKFKKDLFKKIYDSPVIVK